jgi:hypothetical protein
VVKVVDERKSKEAPATSTIIGCSSHHASTTRGTSPVPPSSAHTLSSHSLMISVPARQRGQTEECSGQSRRREEMKGSSSYINHHHDRVFLTSCIHNTRHFSRTAFKRSHSLITLSHDICPSKTERGQTEELRCRSGQGRRRSHMEGSSSYMHRSPQLLSSSHHASAPSTQLHTLS